MLQEELQYKTDLLNVLKQRLQARELQAAKFGSSAEPHVLMDIEEIKKNIVALEQEILLIGNSVVNNRINQRLNSSGIFDAPRYSSQTARAKLLAKLTEVMKVSAVVAVEGIRGTGKSYLVASYVDYCIRNDVYSSVLWYDPQSGETFDDFLAQIEIDVRLNGASVVAKSKELFRILREQNVLVVIDNFEQVVQSSFAAFLSAASRNGEPASLILISRVYVDVTNIFSGISHFEVNGFDLTETEAFVHSRGLKKVDSVVLQELAEKTDGLPLAESFFCTLVVDFNRDPRELLQGDYLSDHRILNWFNEVCMQMGEDETKMLYFLSFCDTPFNIGIVRLAGSKQKIDGFENVFETLQRAYLVQKFTPYRWYVHRLISVFCQIKLDKVEIDVINLYFANYFIMLSNIKNAKFIDDDARFLFKVRACKYFQLAKSFGNSSSILDSIASFAKSRGFYDLFINLCEIEIRENQRRRPWIDYHYAHCCLIVGRIRDSLRIIEPLVYKSSFYNLSQQIAVMRLYAEILEASGQSKMALEKIRETMSAIGDAQVRRVVLRHAQSTEVRILINLGDYTEARLICENLLSNEKKYGTERGKAVAFTLSGIIYRAFAQNERAIVDITTAVDLFKKCNDKRGLGWALIHLAWCQFELGDKILATENIYQGLQIKSDINDCSVDYYETIRDLESKNFGEIVNKIILEEAARISRVYENN